jgi:osmoprotectant transport system ATP-binding protein
MKNVEISFQHVSHSYDGIPVLQDISVRFHKNNITAIIGKSGSGKSTLLQMINGLIRPKRGSVRVFGEAIDYQRLIPFRLRFGYSVQGTGLFPHLTVFENISLVGRVNNYPKDYILERIDVLMRFVDLNDSFLKKYPHQLSGGEQQRVGICRAMLLKPEIFLLDEAFGALDPTTRTEIHREFIDLHKAEPRTVVMVTHDLNEALKLARDILILNEGKIQQFGSKADIISRPANDYVKQFIRSQYEKPE